MSTGFSGDGRYKQSRLDFLKHAPTVERLWRDGFIVLKQVMDRDALLKVKAELEQLLDSGSHVIASKDSVRTAGDLSAAPVALTADELTQGQDYYRRHTNFAWIADPLLNCPSVVRIAFDDLLADIATHYLGCPAAIGTLNLRKSYVNDLSDFDTLYFHSDPNSPRFLKFFFYLNDVDEEGGPFCYVTHTHREKFKGWRRKYRWLHEEIEAQYRLVEHPQTDRQCRRHDHRRYHGLPPWDQGAQQGSFDAHRQLCDSSRGLGGYGAFQTREGRLQSVV